MEINGAGRIDSSEAIRGPQQARAIEPQQSTESVHEMDQIDISPAAELVSQVADLPDIRADRVAEIRAQIDSGVYETEEKLDIAMGRLLDELG